MKKYLLLSIILLFVACSTCKVSKLSSIQEIQFGGGGGVTGKYSKSVVNSKGEVYRDGQKVKKITCQDLSEIFEIAEKIDSSLINPGNASLYISIVRKDTTINLIWAWYQNPDSLTYELYTKLNSVL